MQLQPKLQLSSGISGAHLKGRLTNTSPFKRRIDMYGRPQQQSRKRIQEMSSYYYDNDVAVREVNSAMSNRSNEGQYALPQNDQYSQQEASQQKWDMVKRSKSQARIRTDREAFAPSESVTDRFMQNNPNSISHKLYHLAQKKKTEDSLHKNMNTLRRLQINLHSQQKMPTEVIDQNVAAALGEIERNNDDDQVPLHERGGEVLESVNDVFNLMAMKIKIHADARQQTAEQFGHDTKKYKNKPNVIYMKGPADRLLLMTETVDQSFQRFPRDSKGISGGSWPFPHEKKQRGHQNEPEIVAEEAVVDQKMEEKKLMQQNRKEPVKLAFQAQTPHRGLGAGSIDQQSTERMPYDVQSSNLRSINGSPGADKYPIITSMGETPIANGHFDNKNAYQNLNKDLWNEHNQTQELPKVDPVSFTPLEDQDRISEIQLEEETGGPIKLLSVKSRSQILLQNSAAVPEDTASFEHGKAQNDTHANTGTANTGRITGADALDYDSTQEKKISQTRRNNINQNSTEENSGKPSRLSSGFEVKEFDEEKLFEKYAIKTLIDDIPFQGQTEIFTQQVITDQRRSLVKDALSYGLQLKAQDQSISTQAKIAQLRSSSKKLAQQLTQMSNPGFQESFQVQQVPLRNSVEGSFLNKTAMSFQDKTKMIEQNLINDREIPSEVLTEKSQGRNQGLGNQKFSSYGKPKGGVHSAFKEFTQSLHQDLVGGHAQSIKVLRAQKDEIREHTMRRIESMGLKAPIAWKDELYKIELTKLDLKSALENQGHSKTDQSTLAGLTEGRNKFFVDRSTLNKNFQLMQQRTGRSALQHKRTRIQPNSISNSNAKNLKELRTQGKLNVSVGGTKLNSYMQSLREMHHVEKMIISKEEQQELDRQKHENKMVSAVCGRYLEKEAEQAAKKMLMTSQRQAKMMNATDRTAYSNWNFSDSSARAKTATNTNGFRNGVAGSQNDPYDALASKFYGKQPTRK